MQRWSAGDTAPEGVWDVGSVVGLFSLDLCDLILSLLVGWARVFFVNERRKHFVELWHPIVCVLSMMKCLDKIRLETGGLHTMKVFHRI